MTGIRGNYVELESGTAYFESAGEGPTVLLLHTAGRDSRQWHRVITRLTPHYRLIAPDLPGHGKSWPIQGQRCLDDVEEIAAWLSGLMTAIGTEAFYVAGCSLGGNLTLLLAASDDRVISAVALQGADFTPSISTTSLELMTHPQVNLSFSNMDFTMSLVGSAADPFGRNLIEWGVLSVIGRAQRGDLTAYTNCDIRGLMSDITVPVTLVRGQEDWLVTQSMVEDTMRRLTSSPSARMVTLPGLGHFPHVEAPDVVADLLASAFHTHVAPPLP